MNETFVALGVVTCLVCGLLSITLMFISITETIEYFEWHLVCAFIASIALGFYLLQVDILHILITMKQSFVQTAIMNLRFGVITIIAFNVVLKSKINAIVVTEFCLITDWLFVLTVENQYRRKSANYLQK